MATTKVNVATTMHTKCVYSNQNDLCISLRCASCLCIGRCVSSCTYSSQPDIYRELKDNRSYTLNVFIATKKFTYIYMYIVSNKIALNTSQISERSSKDKRSHQKYVYTLDVSIATKHVYMYIYILTNQKYDIECFPNISRTKQRTKGNT